MLLHGYHIVLAHEADSEVLVSQLKGVIRISSNLLLKHLSDQIIVIALGAVIRNTAESIVFGCKFLTPPLRLFFRRDSRLLDNATLGGHFVMLRILHLALLLDLLNVFVDSLKESP